MAEDIATANVTPRVYAKDVSKGSVTQVCSDAKKQRNLQAGIGEAIDVTGNDAYEEPYTITYEWQNPTYGAVSHSSEKDADRTVSVKDNPNISKGLNWNPSYVPNVPQQSSCKCRKIVIASTIAALCVMVIMISIGTWMHFKNTDKGTTHTSDYPVVDTTYTSNHPAGDTTYTPVLSPSTYTSNFSAVDTTYTSVHSGVNTTYTPGYSAVDTTYTSVHSGVNTTYTFDYSAVNTSYTSVHSGVNTTYTSVDSAVDTTYTSVHSAVDTTYTSDHPVVDTSYTTDRTVVMTSNMTAHPRILPLGLTGFEHEVNTNGVIAPLAQSHQRVGLVVPQKKWRDDWRCGQGFLLENGKPAECDPEGVIPCCSPGNWCGNTADHCDCHGCVDFRPMRGAGV
ncbi:hypothetical protein Bbelb_154820 [Branchiostoma belcheri]|nr:hypothetical protein Bbelb_154820 [Branchiostoma belcheri]